MQHVLELHKPQGTPARARVGELTILVSTFLTSPCFRAVCRCAQGEECKVGDDGYNRLRKEKNKTKLKEQFAIELVWFPVVVTVRGDLTTYDEPADSFVRVTYLDPFGADPAKKRLPRCVWTDGRVELCAKIVPKLAEPRTFEQWLLKEKHSHQTFGQWRRRHRSDGLSDLPPTTRDHVSATKRWSM